MNSARDLFAVTVEPVTKAAFVHFFLTSTKGNVVFVNDVNSRVAKLLSPPWKSDSKGFLRVETIQGRKGRALVSRNGDAKYNFYAIEGNTNPGGARDGYEVAERGRSYSSVRKFTRLPIDAA